MKILVCGGSGILGKELCSLFRDKKIDYVATYNKNKIENGICMNFYDVNKIRQCMDDNSIDICINCICERKVYVCETDWNKTKLVNVDIVRNISLVCCEKNIHFIQISTDYVFDGLNPPYFPDAQENPLQNYGISKFLAEIKVKQICNKYSIIRVPVLYSSSLSCLQDSVVTMIGKKVLDRTTLYKEDNYSVMRPTYIPDFCHFILDVATGKKQSSDHIWHFCNPSDKITKYGIAKQIADFLEVSLNVEPIHRPPNNGDDHPIDTLLLDDKYDIDREYEITPLTVGLSRCFSKLYHSPICKENRDNIFFMLDLDGTLIDSELLHFHAYKLACREYLHMDLSYEFYYNISKMPGIDSYILSKCDNNKDRFNEFKSLKNAHLKTKEVGVVKYMKGAKEFIDFIVDNNINHVVVTNTSLENVEWFQTQLPGLNRLKNWITREDYKNSKPDPECYSLAKSKYYRDEPYMIGIENTKVGYESLLGSGCECIYMMVDSIQNKKEMSKYDVYLFDNYMKIFCAHGAL